MTMPMQLPRPGLAIAELGDKPMSKGWVDWQRDLLLELHRSLVPPRAIIPANLSAANIAAEFDATGLGRVGGPYQWWAVCNGNNSTPNLAGLFVRGSVTAAGGTGGSATSGASSAANSGSGGNDNTGSWGPYTGAPDATVAVQSGAGTTVATDTHTHAVDSHFHTQAAHTHTIAHTHESTPPYHDLVYLMRVEA